MAVEPGPDAATRWLTTALLAALLLAPVASRQLSVIRVSAGQDLQSAIDRAKPGDTILLAQGARFTGSFVLPVHGGASFITIRTDGQGLPGPGIRTSPRHAGTLAVIQSATNSPALRTAPGAHHWRIENVEFGPNRDGEGNIIMFGDAPPKQRVREEIPHTLVLDRVYVHGDAQVGQKRGIALNSGATEISNSYVSDIKTLGVDSQAIGGWNGPGPYTIENNYLEAAGENIMFGGGDPGIEGLVPQDITIRRNHIARPAAWRDPVIPEPSSVGAVAAAGGTLSAGAYVYKVVAERPAGRGEVALSRPAAAREVKVPANGSVQVEWSAVAGATAYRVYRTGGTGPELFWRVTTSPYSDTGAPGTAGAAPSAGSVWQVKNLLELKSARNVVIDGNLFERHWAAAQSGYALLFKPVNQEGGAPWSTVENVRFTNNVVRDIGGGVNINGSDPDRPSSRARGIVIRNNLFVIDTKTWDGPGDFVQVGGGPADVVVERNTVVHDGRILSLYSGKTWPVAEGFVFRGNLLRHNQYGVKGSDTATGRATLDAYAPGAVFQGNIIAGGDRERYPEGNYFFPQGEFESMFVDARASDFRVRREERGFAAAGAEWGALSEAFSASTTAPGAPAPPPRSKD